MKTILHLCFPYRQCLFLPNQFSSSVTYASNTQIDSTENKYMFFCDKTYIFIDQQKSGLLFWWWIWDFVLEKFLYV